MHIYWVRYRRHGSTRAQFINATNKRKACKQIKGKVLELAKIR